MELSGATALVTGGAVGVGLAIARAFAAAGSEVWIADIQAPADGVWRFVDADVTDDAALQELIAAARPDVLVNNAGGLGHIPPHFPQAPPETWGHKLDLNLRAPMRATQLALAAGTRAVVNVASMAGWEDGPAPSPEYAAAKAGLIRFTTALAGLDGARVSCVVPGWIATERGLAERAAMAPAERAAAPPMVPEDAVAHAVVALARDEAAAGRVVVLRGDGS
jgi:NAD(P)-dependent dehydrogenase (short-subunit alcohol dehydrogenase family)